jgi:hypothetical protein
MKLVPFGARCRPLARTCGLTDAHAGSRIARTRAGPEADYLPLLMNSIKLLCCTRAGRAPYPGARPAAGPARPASRRTRAPRRPPRARPAPRPPRPARPAPAAPPPPPRWRPPPRAAARRPPPSPGGTGVRGYAMGKDSDGRLVRRRQRRRLRVSEHRRAGRRQLEKAGSTEAKARFVQRNKGMRCASALCASTGPGGTRTRKL